MAKGESVKVQDIRRTFQASRKNERPIYFEGEGRPLLTGIVEAGPSREGFDKNLPELRLSTNVLTQRFKLSVAYEGRLIQDSPCLCGAWINAAFLDSCNRSEALHEIQ